jgi:hypothetical protein
VPSSVLSSDPLARDPLTSHPGTSHPGTSHPGTRHPGTGHPGTGHPGTGDRRAKDPGAAVPDAPGPARGRPGRLLVLYGRLLGLLLVGYLLFDKGFAYLHLPGTPLYAGELVLLAGALGVLTSTGYLRVVIRDEPVLALLAGFFLWGLVRLLPGLRAYGILAVRDFALVYYCLFAFFTAAALARSPGILGRWIAGFARLVPWLLAWLPPATILGSLLSVGPHVPFSSVQALTHAAGSAAVAALLALGFLWLFPGTRSLRGRVAWSVLALAVIVLSATQNRGGLLGVAAGAVVGLAFFRGPSAAADPGRPTAGPVPRAAAAAPSTSAWPAPSGRRRDRATGSRSPRAAISSGPSTPRRRARRSACLPRPTALPPPWCRNAATPSSASQARCCPGRRS